MYMACSIIVYNLYNLKSEHTTGETRLYSDKKTPSGETMRSLATPRRDSIKTRFSEAFKARQGDTSRAQSFISISREPKTTVLHDSSKARTNTYLDKPTLSISKPVYTTGESGRRNTARQQGGATPSSERPRVGAPRRHSTFFALHSLCSIENNQPSWTILRKLEQSDLYLSSPIPGNTKGESGRGSARRCGKAGRVGAGLDVTMSR